MTAEQLAARTKHGDDAAFAALTRRFRPMIVFLLRDLYIRGAEFDDLLQEAHLGLYKAACDYRPEVGASFNSFAKLCVTRQLYTAVKTATRGKHQLLTKAVRHGVDEDGEQVDILDMLPARDADPVDQLARRDALATVVSVVSHDLSPVEHAVIVGLLNDETYLETADRLDYTTTTRPDGRMRAKKVDNALQRARRKVLAALEEAA